MGWVGGWIFKPRSTASKHPGQAVCAMEMIKANGFSRTQICHWTFKVCIFRVYKCAGRPERRRLQAGSTVELGHGVPQLSGAKQKIPSSAFQHFPITLSHTPLLYLEPHRSIQKKAIGPGSFYPATVCIFSWLRILLTSASLPRDKDQGVRTCRP